MNQRRSWAVAICAILMAIACSVGMFTVPATMVFIIEGMGISVADASWLMTIVAIVSTILSLPGGIIIDKLGVRRSTIVFMLCAVAGHLLCWLAPSFGIMLFGRALQGVAYGLVSLFAPAIISKWFPADKRGLPMAIECLYVAIGMTLILNAANGITPTLGWQANFALAAALCLISLLLYVFIGKEDDLPFFEENAPSSAEKEKSSSAIVDGLKAPGAWLLLVIMIGFGFGQSAFASYFPTYLITDLGMDAAAANQAASVASVVNIIVGILAGVVLTKIGQERFASYIAIAMVLVVICYAIMFNCSPETVIPVAVFAGVAMQALPAATFTTAPLTAKTEASTGTVLGIVVIGVNVCAVFGNAFVGYFVEATGSYGGLTVPLTVLAVIGLLASIGLVIVMKKKYAESES